MKSDRKYDGLGEGILKVCSQVHLTNLGEFASAFADAFASAFGDTSTLQFQDALAGALFICGDG